MPASKKTSASHKDALSLLEADHKHVRKLFKEFEKIKEKGEADDKEALVDEICAELTLHADVEEEIFYPAARQAIKEEDLVNEAEVEHATARDLIEQLQSMTSADPLYDAKVKVLSEYIEHHVQEEEKEMFTKVKKAKVDLESLGEQILEMKEARESQLLAGQSKKPGKGAAARQ